MSFQRRRKPGSLNYFLKSQVIENLKQKKSEEIFLQAMSKARLIVLGVFLASVMFVIGVFSGTLLHFNGSSGSNFPDESIKQKLLNEISKEEIKMHLRVLTSQPHSSNTKGDKYVVDYIRKFWNGLKFDSIETISYKVLLPEANQKNPNMVTIHDRDGAILEKSKPFEPILVPEQNDSRVMPPFNAFSPPGKAEGGLVYINYGRASDFELAVKKGVPLKGNICLVRYGFNFRGDKVSLAEKHGCIGMILYSDPDDFDVNDTSNVYPDSWSMPEGGVQRGSISKSFGDPLTPFYPSTEYAFRLNISEANLPKIPCHAIGYGDARKLFKYMGGEEVPKEWRGGMENVTYRFGGALTNLASYVSVSVTANYTMGFIHNVFGIIEGSVEPDRYVLVGNHHDAWVFGAVDPSSGTAVMLELSRAFSSMIEQGWRPRRTIIFCAWGGEEHGIMGSTEWVEDFRKILHFRVVSYLNVDSAVQGRHVLKGRCLPLLNTVMFNAAKSVPNPDTDEVKAGRTTVYDTWTLRIPDDTSIIKRPMINLVGSGSDFAAFVSSLGVSSADIRYSFDPHKNISSYPLYHTGYETYHLFTTYHDPDFVFSRALCQVWSEMVRQLADFPVLPLDIKEFIQFLQTSSAAFLKKRRVDISAYNITLAPLLSALDNLTGSATEFQHRLQEIDIRNFLQVRSYNDQLMHLERSFINDVGLPGRPTIRNVMYAPSKYNSYSATVFPGVSDALNDLVDNKYPHLAEHLLDNLRQQLSILTFFIQSAANLLKKPSHFLRS